jgi:hypothetical protein
MRMIIREARCMGWPRRSLFSQVLEDSMKRGMSWLGIEKESCRKTEEVEGVLSAETLLESGMVSRQICITLSCGARLKNNYACFSVSLLCVLKWSVYSIALWSTVSNVLFCVTSHTSQPVPVIILFYLMYSHTVAV